MAFDSDVLLSRLRALTRDDDPQRWLVAFSGGIDSTVLLHALVQSDSGVPVVAVHVDHGLHPDAAAWTAHASEIAEALGVEFIALSATVTADSDAGPEAAAREARYRALGSVVERDDCVLSAHHENDQAETLLLNLMRGSGPAGIAGIGARNPFGRGVLVRPMIGVSGDDIAEYARRHALRWISDPSNEDPAFDRNFLRHEVMPILKSRWPAVADRLRRSAELAGEAAELQDALADIDIDTCGDERSLSIALLSRLPPARQRNLLRRAIRRCGLPPAPATALYRVIDELVPARMDRQPLVDWPGGEIRRFRDAVFVLSPLADVPDAPGRLLHADGAFVALGDQLGRLKLVASETAGVDPAVARQGLAIRFRSGGEVIRLAEDGVTHKLKKLLQEKGVVPWMRDRLPLIYAGEDLVAVADLWVSSDHLAGEGLAIEWHEKPPIL